MRKQYNSQPHYLGIVFGAGVSIGLGFPGWRQLVQEIANSDEMKEFSFAIDTSNDIISNSQKLYQLYKSKQYEECNDYDKEYNRIEMIVRANWQRIVHKALYRKHTKNISDLVPKQHYLWEYIDIIKELPMIVNYNFDDTIQRMLAASRTECEKETTRGYTTVWNSNIYMCPKKE